MALNNNNNMHLKLLAFATYLVTHKFDFVIIEMYNDND